MPTMAEVRAKFPQYGDMSDGDLAGALHKKFYADMPAEEFNRKIGFKAPDPLNVKGPPDRGILGSINNFVGGVSDAITQGATFGFADELGAGVRAGARHLTDTVGLTEPRGPTIAQVVTGELTGAPIPQSNYDRSLADIRGREKEFAEEHPVASTVGNLAGGLLGFRPQVLGPGAVAAAPAAQSIPRTLAKATATGAGMGALGGFGAGEGGFENRLSSAGTGAAVGGVIGMGLPAIGAGASKVLGVGANLLGLRDPKKVALDNLGRALGRDEVTPTAVQDTLNATAKPMAIVDATGNGLMTTNTQRLGRTVETIPGKGSARAHEFLQERQLGQADRVGDDIATNLGGDDFHKTLDDLDKTRRATAAPLYDEAYAQPIAWNATIETLLDRPSTKKALANARRIAEEEGRDPSGLGLVAAADGNVTLDKTAASMQTLDYVKRGLDDVLEPYRNELTGKLELDESGKAIDRTRRDFVKSVDDANPKYAEARKAWGGPTQTMEAARLGRNYARGDAEVTLARFRELSPGDQDAFRLGVARELAGKVENTRDGANSVNRIFGSKGQRSRLQALFPDDASFQAFEKAMSDEGRMSHTRQVVAGGPATGRIAAEQDDAAALTNVAMDYAGGGARSVLFGLAGRAASKARGMNEASADELSKMLFSSDRAAQARALVEVQRRQQLLADRAARGVQAAMAGAAGGSNLAGQGLAGN